MFSQVIYIHYYKQIFVIFSCLITRQSQIFLLNYVQIAVLLPYFMSTRSRTPFWYNVLLKIAQPVYAYRIRKRFGHLPDVEQEIQQRFGQFAPAKNHNVIWFHVVSVGETNAAQPLIQHYLQQGQAVLITNTTRTGQAQAQHLFKNYPEICQTVYLPIDRRDVVQQFIQHYQPKIVLLMETELWPNLIAVCHDLAIPQILINARLSAKSAKGYARFKSLIKPMLQRLNFIAAQNQDTQQRYIELGISPQKIGIYGNVKFDITAPLHFIQQAEQLKHQWQLVQRNIILLASTHADEEYEIIQRLQHDLKQNPALLCIVVPRHPERFNDVAEQIQRLGLQLHRRSLNQSIEKQTQVYLADSMGELWLWYALSQVAYVGGSLNSTGGGHNILEPIALNVATVLGHKYFNFQNIVDEFKQQNALIVVQDYDNAAKQLYQLIENPQQRQQLNQNAEQILKQNQGSVKQHIALINQYLST